MKNHLAPIRFQAVKYVPILIGTWGTRTISQLSLGLFCRAGKLSTEIACTKRLVFIPWQHTSSPLSLSTDYKPKIKTNPKA